ncbi:hypothetical protein COOONC_22641 [Cooperia oncophora]
MLSRLALRPSLLISPSVRQLSMSVLKTARMGRSSTTGIHRFGEQAGIGVRTGKTLKERLLGPTTGAPYIYGTYALAGASVFGVGALMYYGLVSKEQSILQSSALWPAYVRERLASTYSYLAGGLAVTAASGVAASRNAAIMRLTQAGGVMGLFATLAVIIGTGMLCRSIDYDSTIAKHLAWMLHCGAMGAVLAPLVYMGGPVLMRAAWYTAGIVGGLSATAITAPSEKFLMMSGPLAMGLGVVFVANIGTFFFHPGNCPWSGFDVDRYVWWPDSLLSIFTVRYPTCRKARSNLSSPRRNVRNASEHQELRSYQRPAFNLHGCIEYLHPNGDDHGRYERKSKEVRKPIAQYRKDENFNYCLETSSTRQ